LSNKHDKRGYRIGIDAYIWFFHAHSSREGENPELRMLFFRLARFLAMPILPVFVFDGPAKPRWKRNKQVGGRQHALLGSFKEMIKAFGFEWHQASTSAFLFPNQSHCLHRHRERQKPSWHILIVSKLLTPFFRMMSTTFCSAPQWSCESE
jgi:hypothetical protein